MRRALRTFLKVTSDRSRKGGDLRFRFMEGRDKKRRLARASRAILDSEEDEPTGFGSLEVEALRQGLLAWYDRNHRVLPWRRNRNSRRDDGSSEGAPDDLPDQKFAYMVWVSEIMLQQTRVATVIDYFLKWMKKWPTVEELSKASQEEVNDCWAGLGYYRRARYLLEGAKYVVNELAGEFPEDAVQLGKIPGIGPYTAGAISSIAFGKVEPLVDGNVVRVLARLRALSDDPASNSSKKLHWELASQLVDPKRPGDFNQAVMELGATVCTPKGPSCASCPVRKQCQAYAQQSKGNGTVMDYPPKVEKAPPKDVNVALCIFEEVTGKDERGFTKTRFLLVQRPEGGLLAGLWEFPSVIVDKETKKSEKKELVAARIKELLGTDVNGGGFKLIHRSSLGQCTHVFSHQKHTMEVEWMLVSRAELSIPSSSQDGPSIRWVDGDSIGSHPLTTGQKKALNLLSGCTARIARIGEAPGTSNKRGKGEGGVKMQSSLVGFLTKKEV